LYKQLICESRLTHKYSNRSSLQRKTAAGHLNIGLKRL